MINDTVLFTIVTMHITEVSEEVLDTPGPEHAPYFALGTLVTVCHGDIPDSKIHVLLNTLDQLLLLLLDHVQDTVLTGSRTRQREASYLARPCYS